MKTRAAVAWEVVEIAACMFAVVGCTSRLEELHVVDGDDASAPQYAPYHLETITKETVDHDIYVGRGR